MLEVDVRVERAGLPFPLELAFRTAAPVTGVFGPSGAGKTSLLHLVAGLLAPTGGTIRLDGTALFDRDRGVAVPAHRRGVVMVFQDDRLFPHLSVAGNLGFGGRRATAAQREDIVACLALRPLLERRVRHLSGGERQRVALGRALLAAPRLLLLDEPLSSLDHGQRREILGLIRRVRDELGVPMLYVSHELTELLQLTECLLVVERGRVVGHGPLHEVVRETSAWHAVRDLGPLNVLALEVRGHDAEAGLTELVPSGRETATTLALVGPLVEHAPGTSVRVAVRPEDVAFAAAPVSGVSIQNQLPARVRRVTRHPDRALVEVDAGVRLLVEVSHRTVHQMDLAEGRAVHCLIKSNALRYLD